MAGVTAVYLFGARENGIGLKPKSYCRDTEGLSREEQQAPASSMQNQSSDPVSIKIDGQARSVNNIAIGGDHYIITGNPDNGVMSPTCSNVGYSILTAIKDENNNGKLDSEDTKQVSIWVYADTLSVSGPKIIEISVTPFSPTESGVKYYFAKRVYQ